MQGIKPPVSQPQSLGVGLLGFGTVGSAVYTILEENRAEIFAETRMDVRVRQVCVANLAKERPVLPAPGLLTDDPAQVLDDPAIDVVVEVIGGMEPARSYIERALRNGKSVVTANKEVIAAHGKELLELAEKHDVDLLYEASVGGGIPILRPLKESLAAGRIRRIMGIVNGTTNYILSQMSLHGRTYAEALQDAQRLGYAEADPTADVEGHDAARKLAILGTIAFHTRIGSEDVFAEGITRITPEDIRFGQQQGWSLKLLAMAQLEGEQYAARVHPAFIPASHPLAHVNDSFNAIYVHGDEVGETMFYGRGAGGMPTASAAVGDLVAVAKYRRRGVAFSRPHTYQELVRREHGQTTSRYYVRLMPLAAAEVAAGQTQALQAAGGEGVVAAATTLGQELQAQLALAGVPLVNIQTDASDLVLITDVATEEAMQAALKRLQEHSGNVVRQVIRICTDM